MKTQFWLYATLLLIVLPKAHSQGPPITVDAPIMLGGKTQVINSLTEIRTTEAGTFVSFPVMYQYLPNSNSVVAISIPWVSYDFKEGVFFSDDHQHGQLNTGFPQNGKTLQPFNPTDTSVTGTTLGDIMLTGKYQLYRNDGTGKTFRVAAKTVQTLPTGEKLGIRRMSMGYYQGYYGFITAYESLRFGVANELGYNWSPKTQTDEFVHKLGFGLPLLKPTYPVNQINLYFEYSGYLMTQQSDYQLLFAQGIQYAKGKYIVEASLQLPLVQNMPELQKHKSSLFIGGRYVF
jgi:hypothetical protein